MSSEVTLLTILITLPPSVSSMLLENVTVTCSQENKPQRNQNVIQETKTALRLFTLQTIELNEFY